MNKENQCFIASQSTIEQVLWIGTYHTKSGSTNWITITNPSVTRINPRLSNNIKQQTPFTFGQNGFGADIASIRAPARRDRFDRPVLAELATEYILLGPRECGLCALYRLWNATKWLSDFRLFFIVDLFTYILRVLCMLHSSHKYRFRHLHHDYNLVLTEHEAEFDSVDHTLGQDFLVHYLKRVLLISSLVDKGAMCFVRLLLCIRIMYVPTAHVDSPRHPSNIRDSRVIDRTDFVSPHNDRLWLCFKKRRARNKKKSEIRKCTNYVYLMRISKIWDTKINLLFDCAFVCSSHFFRFLFGLLSARILFCYFFRLLYYYSDTVNVFSLLRLRIHLRHHFFLFVYLDLH